MRTARYLSRCHGSSICMHGVDDVLVRGVIDRLQTRCHECSMLSMRFQEEAPGYHSQVGVHLLHQEEAEAERDAAGSYSFGGRDEQTAVENAVQEEGRKVRRLRYTAIDDAARIRAPRLHEQHAQAAEIEFIDHVVRPCNARAKYAPCRGVGMSPAGGVRFASRPPPVRRLS